MSKHKIHHANIKEWAANYEGELFDAILCDPPYELGFMGKSWDSSGIAFDKDMWADLYRIIKPGGHLLAFSGSRTYHRMACAIEDAGFEIRDMIEWVYGSGFPKSLNIGKAVDKIQGNEREVLGERKVPDQRGGGINSQRTAEMGVPTRMTTDTKGTSPYEGYGTALKPAHEPCVLARKPLDKGMTVASNVLKHGTGGLNIDGTRVKTDEQLNYGTGKKSNVGFKTSPQNNDRPVYDGSGRFPANLIHDGSDEVEAVFPDTGKSGVAVRRNGNKSKGIFPVSIAEGSVDVGFNDSGSASRFFYCAKASKSERNTGRFPANLIHDGSDEVEAVFPQTKNGGGNSTSKRETWLRQETEPTQYAGDKGSASRFFYTAKASKSERNAGLEGFEERVQRTMNDYSEDGENRNSNKPKANYHPTVKPLALTKYLATLIKPPTGGRILVPFSGSGSEMIGALQAGWGYVEGVELTEEYIPIAEARLAHWIDHEKSWTPQT